MPGHQTVELGDYLKLLGVSVTTANLAAAQVAPKDNNIGLDRFDRDTFGELVKASSALERLLGQGPGTFPALLRDVWATYYKMSPELVPEDQVNPVYRSANRPFVERMQEDKTVAEARLTTVLDELAAGLATVETGRKLLEEINQRPELKEAFDLAERAAQAAVRGEDDQAQALLNRTEQACRAAAREIRRAVRVAAEAGRDKAEELQVALAGWGLEPGDLQRVPLGERLKLAERLLTPKFRKLADLVGRFRNLARARQKEKLRKERDELHGITVGADIARLLPAELAMLRHPLRRLDFYRRFTERQLLQYELRTREPQGRGPIICLVDASGSMAGEPMDWAVAVALGLVDTAARQKRRSAVIFFDTRILAEYHFEPRERDVDKIIAIATTGTAGGTDYAPALERAMELAASSAYRKADVVMITDGICRLTPEYVLRLLTMKARLGTRIWSVLIGTGSAAELKRWSDQVWATSQATEDVAGEIFEEVW